MARSEKDLEIEGRTISTQELIDETERILTLARKHQEALQREGLKLNDLVKMTAYRQMLIEEQERLDTPPLKRATLDRQQQRVMFRAFQWRALLLSRVDRALIDEPYARIKYRRLLHLYREPSRVYEELTVLWEHAKLDAKKLLDFGVDDKFLEAGEDLRCELQGYPPPDREAWQEYQIKLRNHRYGPPPKPPENSMPDLPEVNDSSMTLAIARGRLHRDICEISALGKAAFSNFEGKEPRGYEAIRRDFDVQISPSEFLDETLLYFGPTPSDGSEEVFKTTRKDRREQPRGDSLEEPAQPGPIPIAGDGPLPAPPTLSSPAATPKPKRKKLFEDTFPDLEDDFDAEIVPLDIRPDGRRAGGRPAAPRSSNSPKRKVRKTRSGPPRDRR